MASTYTPKLNLAKPAHGDVDWHIPINGNWDKIDTELDKALKISGTMIDADKNWNGKNITNLGYIAATRIRSEASDTVRYGPKTGNISLTIPSIYVPGSTVRIKFHVVSPYINDHHYSNTATLKIDGVVVATVTPPFDNYRQTSTDYVGDHTVNGGSTITLTSTQSGDTSGITISCTDTAPVTYPAPPTWPA